MSKDFPKTGEAGIAAPADQPAKVGPVAGNVDPEQSTKVAPAGALSPLENAKALKQVKLNRLRVARVNNEPATFDEFSPQHAAAEALHGWKEHEHHEGKPIALSADDYAAALDAAWKPVTRALDKDGKPTGAAIDSAEAAKKGIPTITDYEPHKPALSPHQGKGL